MTTLSLVPSVLVVEDVVEMLELLVQCVSRLSPHVTRASNRPEMQLELQRRCPQVVLLDEVFLGESLEDMISDIRILPSKVVHPAESIKVILITSVEDRKAALPQGVLGRLYKPSWKAESQMRFLDEVIGLLK